MFGKKLYLFLTLLFVTQFAQAQLSNFTLNVTKTDETCTANGTLTFSVSNTTGGATMLYSVFLLPNVTTPISIQSATTISGLVAGNYRVVATQSLGSQSGAQQFDITINNMIHPLTYQLSSTNEICGNDGAITVSVTAGTALNYEIISGPMIRPLQTSPVFTGLTAGVYQIRVFDICHQGFVRTYTLFRSDTALNITLSSPSLVSCNIATIGFTFQTVLVTGVIRYPIQVVTTVTPPTGSSTTYNQTINSGSGYAQQLPYVPNQIYQYSFVITDGCGRIYNLSGTIQLAPVGGSNYAVAPQDCIYQVIGFSNVTSLVMTVAPPGYLGALPQSFTASIVNFAVTVRNLIPGTYVFTCTDLCGNSQTVTIVVPPNQNGGTPPFSAISNQTCTDATVFIYEIQQLVMITAPAAYTVPLPHDYTSIINNAHYAAFVHLPIGTYVFNVVDRCGNPRTVTVIITPQTGAPSASILEGCENGVGSAQIFGDLVTISLLSAPAAYPGSVPANLTTSITSNGTKLILDSLPPGNYVFQSTNSCNGSLNTNITITGYQENTNVALTSNCGSFNFNLNHTSNNNNNPATFWMQKYDAVTGNWVHPETNLVYTHGTLPTIANSFQVTNNVPIYNLAFTGHFRILKVFKTYSVGQSSPVNCFKVIYEFDFSDAPRIVDVYSISCGSSYEVIVNAVGNSALSYRIIAKDGQPFLVQNGSSSLFSGLMPGIYTFEVEDVCQNSVNIQFQVLNPNPMIITASQITCDGDSVFLTVPNFAFLTYEWWKDNNTSAILSATNSLSFTSFNSALNNGIYHVRIAYTGNPNSCLNQVLDYEIQVNTTIPHAGNDNAVSYCGRQGIIDVATLLVGSFDALGIWTEITSSGVLTNNLWDSSNNTVPFGTYQFRYTVSGSCNATDFAVISITVKDIPPIPTASVGPLVCEAQDLNLFATTVPNGTYSWVGPNGFIATIQNPVINTISSVNNGVYSVHASQNGCQSGNSTVAVLVNPSPDFDLTQDCVGKDYQLWFVNLNDSAFDEANSTFSWSGPNNFTSNQSPITITGGELGMYSLNVTNQFGCQANESIEVLRNICFIPNVITPNNDYANESLNLIGFEVDKLEIYNRWGMKVYEKSNYQDEWHGQNINGGLLPDSTYYYVIKLSTAEIKTGWIFLSRG